MRQREAPSFLSMHYNLSLNVKEKADSFLASSLLYTSIVDRKLATAAVRE